MHCIELSELIDDERFKDNSDRNQNYDELRPLIAPRFLTKTTKEWQEILDDEGIPNGPINTIDKVVNNIQVLARDMIVEVYHPVAKNIKMPGIPIKLSETPGSIRYPPPTLGQHTREILKEYLGFDDEAIDKLAEEGAV
jgi:CoA:oxalate CoA-transferase